MRPYFADVPCPGCQQRQSRVVDSVGTKRGSVRRRRACACGRRYTTYERAQREPRELMDRLTTIAKGLSQLQKDLAILRSQLQ